MNHIGIFFMGVVAGLMLATIIVSLLVIIFSKIEEKRLRD